MELVEVTTEQRLRREEAAARLRALADELARHNAVEFAQGGIRHTLRVPDEVSLSLEIEVKADGAEIEVELSW